MCASSAAKRIAIAKEMRHADEQILKQRARLERMRADEIEILRDAFRAN